MLVLLPASLGKKPSLEVLTLVVNFPASPAASRLSSSSSEVEKLVKTCEGGALIQTGSCGSDVHVVTHPTTVNTSCTEGNKVDLYCMPSSRRPYLHSSRASIPISLPCHTHCRLKWCRTTTVISCRDNYKQGYLSGSTEVARLPHQLRLLTKWQMPC